MKTYEIEHKYKVDINLDEFKQEVDKFPSCIKSITASSEDRYYYSRYKDYYIRLRRGENKTYSNGKDTLFEPFCELTLKSNARHNIEKREEYNTLIENSNTNFTNTVNLIFGLGYTSSSIVIEKVECQINYFDDVIISYYKAIVHQPRDKKSNFLGAFIELELASENGDLRTLNYYKQRMHSIKSIERVDRSLLSLAEDFI